MASRGGSLRNKSSDDIVRLLRHFGFELKRSGKHDTYEGYRGGQRRTAQVPRENPNIPMKTLYSILQQAGISKQEARTFWS